MTVVPPISLAQVLGGHLRTTHATSNGLLILLQGALGVDQVGKLDTITLRDLYVLLVKQLIASSPDLLGVLLFNNQLLFNFAFSASIVACCFAVVLKQESHLMILKTNHSPLICRNLQHRLQGSSQEGLQSHCQRSHCPP